MGDEAIILTDVDDGPAQELSERIYRFNVEATDIGDGRWLRAAVRDEDGQLVAGLAGWTWGVAATSIRCGSEPTVAGRQQPRN